MTRPAKPAVTAAAASKPTGSPFAALALAVDTPARLVLVHPVTRAPLRDESGEPAAIEVHSGDSAIARQHAREVARRRLAQRAGASMTPEQLEAADTDLLVALTAGWHLVGLDGKALDVPFTPANARQLYDAPGMKWLRDQVDAFAADRANFAAPLSTS